MLTALDERVVPNATIHSDVKPFNWVSYDENGQRYTSNIPAGVTLHTTVTSRADNTYLWTYEIRNQSLAPPETHQIGKGVTLWGFDAPHQQLLPGRGPEAGDYRLTGSGIDPSNPTDLLYWDCSYAGGVLPGMYAKFTEITPVVPLIPVTAYISAGTFIDWYACTTVAPKPLPSVWIGGFLPANEAGDSPTTVTNGVFYFGRTGDLSQPLTVNVTFDSSGDYATEGTDYTAPHSATFPADDPANGVDGSTAFLVVTPKKDNLIEDDEVIRAILQPVSGYLLSPSQEAYLGLTDDPPQAWATAEWASPSDWPFIGLITISRSGGDVSQPLATWVEVEGDTYDNVDGCIPLVLAFTYTIPADLFSVLVHMQADEGGRPDVAGGGIITREDRTQNLKDIVENGARDPGEALTEYLRQLPSPITHNEYRYLQTLVNSTAVELAGLTPAEKLRVSTAATNYLATSRTVDWSTLLAPALANAGGAGVWGMMYQGGLWPKFRKQVDDLIPQLGAERFADREAASAALWALFNSALNKTDLMSAAYLAWKLKTASEAGSDPEPKRRAEILYNRCVANTYLLFFPDKKLP